MKYEDVPFIITSKDLDYLSDAFNWEHIAYKFACYGQSMTEDETLSNHFAKAAKMSNNHMKTLLEIIEEGKNESSK